MNKSQTNSVSKPAVIAIIVIIVVFLGFTSWAMMKSEANSIKFPTRDQVIELNADIDYNNYNLNEAIAGNSQNGNIADHVKGDINTAKVVIFEYADFQCEYCAMYNPYVNTIIDEYHGDVAVVYRNYLLSYHNNGVAAASAAEAAGLQGYWKEYMNYLFTNQSDWYYLGNSMRSERFIEYFETVTEGKGNLEKFKSDLTSQDVAKKLAFDIGAGAKIDIQGTPAFYIDGELINLSASSDGVLPSIRLAIDEKLAEK